MSYTFNTPPGQTVERKMYLCCGNYGTPEAPRWGKLGKRVEESSAEMDWGEESKQDILGDTYSTMKKPVISQTFDPCELDAGDPYSRRCGSWRWWTRTLRRCATRTCFASTCTPRTRREMCSRSAITALW